MRRIDEYLTRKARGISDAYFDAVVYCDDGGPVEVWTLERVGTAAIGLGGSFATARRAILSLRGPKSSKRR